MKIRIKETLHILLFFIQHVALKIDRNNAELGGVGWYLEYKKWFE